MSEVREAQLDEELRDGPLATVFGEVLQQVGVKTFQPFVALLQRRQIRGEGVFVGEAFAHAVRLDGPVIDAPATVVEFRAELAEAGTQFLAGKRLELAAGFHPDLVRKPFGGDLADAVDLRGGQVEHERRHRARLDGVLAIGLVEVAGDLGKHLVGGDAGGGGQRGDGEDAGADFPGNLRGGAGEVADIQVGFVEGKRLDERRVFEKHGADLGALGAVEIEPRGHHDELRTTSQRHEGRHGGADAVLARLVVAGGQHAAPLARAADSERVTAQVRAFALLASRVEAIHIDMDDLAGSSGSGRLDASMIRGVSSEGN